MKGTMKIIVSVVGVIQNPDDKPVEWPEGWPAPREGDTVYLLDRTLYVRLVVWCPQGSEKLEEPCVYIVVGPTLGS